MKMCAGSFGKSFFIIVRVWWMAMSYARNMFCRPGSRSASLIFFLDYIFRIQLLLSARCLLFFGGD